jgi:hypothetical protein
MPTPGLSLVGFMADETQALFHLKTVCLPPENKTDEELREDWRGAKARLGEPPLARPGTPDVRPIPLSDAHVQSLFPVWGQTLQSYISQGASFAWIEIEPLLLFNSRWINSGLHSIALLSAQHPKKNRFLRPVYQAKQKPIQLIFRYNSNH